MSCEREERTPLQLASEMRQLGIVRALYDRDAKKNVRPAYEFGRTALKYCTTITKIEVTDDKGIVDIFFFGKSDVSD